MDTMEGDVAHFPAKDRNTKKVRFKDKGGDGESDSDRVVDRVPLVSTSWRDMVLGKGSIDWEKESDLAVFEENEDLEFLEGDVLKSTIDGILSINFSDHIQQILVKDMELMVVVKLLGWNIGYAVLYNQVSSLWKPSRPFRLMDIENGLSGLPGHLYKRKIILKIGGLVGRVEKVRVNREIQKVEYEALPLICINCGKYGYTKDLCPLLIGSRGQREEKEPAVGPSSSNEDQSNEPAVFGPWMQVQRKSWRNIRDSQNQSLKKQGKAMPGLRFAMLIRPDENEEDMRDGCSPAAEETAHILNSQSGPSPDSGKGPMDSGSNIMDKALGKKPIQVDGLIVHGLPFNPETRVNMSKLPTTGLDIKSQQK
ncbi:hypothetical protein GOBAR_DD07669 [Gossypium barbadense]|nr:hypothetical protein GOBAR_DD07669 [Gossypium barbadense]